MWLILDALEEGIGTQTGSHKLCGEIKLRVRMDSQQHSFIYVEQNGGEHCQWAKLNYIHSTNLGGVSLNPLL